MAALTWRNIDAPDFRQSLEGYARFSEQLENSIGGLQRGINTFEREQDKQQEAAFQRETAKYGSAELLEQALQQNPTLGLKADRISPQALDASQARVNMLLGRDNTKLDIADKTADIAFEDYSRTRIKGENAATDAAKPILAEVNRLFDSGDQEGAKALMAQNQGVLSQLTPEQYTNVLKTGRGFRKDDLDIKSAEINNAGQIIRNQSGALEYKQAFEGYTQNKELQSVVADLARNNDSYDDALSALNAREIKDPAVYNSALAGLGAIFGKSEEAYSNTAITGGNFSGGEVLSIDDTRKAVQSVFPGTTVTSLDRPPSHPLSKKNPSSVHNTASELYRQGYRAIDVGRPKGNITYEQFLQKAISNGLNVDVKRSIDEYKKPSGHSTGGHWHLVLKPGSKPNFGNQSPINITPERIAAVNTRLQTIPAKIPGIDNLDQFIKLNKTEVTDDAGAAALKTTFKGSGRDAGYYQGLIRRVKAQAGVNTAVAVQIIKNSGKEGQAPTILGIEYGGRNPGYHVDEQLLRQKIAPFKQQGTSLLNTAVSSTQQKGAQAVLAAAQADYTKARQLRDRAVQSGKNVAKYEGQFSRASQILSDALGEADSFAGKSLDIVAPVTKKKKKSNQVSYATAFAGGPKY